MTDIAAIPVSPLMNPTGADLRHSVSAYLAQGRIHEAVQSAALLLEQQPGRGTHRFLRAALAAAGVTLPGLTRLKVALLSSFSIEFLHDSLVALGFATGLRIELYQAGFGTFRQELLDPASALYAWSPDVVLLAVEGEDWVPAAFAAFMDPSRPDPAEIVRQFSAELGALAQAFRERSTAPLLIHNLASPCWRALGIVDAKTSQGQGRLLALLNEALSALSQHSADVHIVDYAALVHRHGALNWYDERMKLYARVPIANPLQHYLSAEYVKFFSALSGLTKKCLVLDLDNTLWGGVIGEDGPDGIQLGPDYPGNAYLEFQRLLLDLHRRGVILAIASKNNAADVEEVLNGHRFMVLKKDHFANLQIHWEAKHLSLMRIAEQLSIGLEHLVFVDDNPAECAEIRRTLPMVRVIQLPAQPERYVRVVQETGLFDMLSVSAEDRRRGELYRQRAQAETVRASLSSVEDYYCDLQMEIALRPVNQASLARAAQLTQKTNQFNVTTRRYSEAELARRMSDADWIVTTIALRDRFGDNGIVGLGMARQDGPILEIDNLLLSCRVIGRTVESALLADLCEQGRQRGAQAIQARVIPTAKNIPARDLFERHGFTKIAEDATGATTWWLDLQTSGVAWPAWFTCTA